MAIEIVGLPMKHMKPGDFPVRYVKVFQRLALVVDHVLNFK